MKRAIILMMDSFGVGASHDASKFGDIGGDTFGNIWRGCINGKGDFDGIRNGALKIPNLLKLGLGNISHDSTGAIYPKNKPISAYGYATEISSGKDTQSGHWEIAGLPVTFDWGLFPDKISSFPQSFIDSWIDKCQLTGILGNKHASGTDIITEFGMEHLKTNKPICYTSADSVFQIAVHEELFGLERLYQICEIAKEMLLSLNIGRVIARPFSGDNPINFTRTNNRRDYATPPHGDTLLDILNKDGGEVIAIGKIADIFANSGISKKITAYGNMNLFDATLNAMEVAGDKSLIFTNFVDFDMYYGHRRDLAGYANSLEEFDKRLPELLNKLQDDDLLLITADHGCDPTFKGNDHTREYVPVIFYGKNIKPQNLGKRTSFSDMGQSIASYLNIKKLEFGKNCFKS